MTIDENKSRGTYQESKRGDVLFNAIMINYFFPFHVVCLLLSLIFSCRIGVKSYRYVQNRIKNNASALDIERKTGKVRGYTKLA